MASGAPSELTSDRGSAPGRTDVFISYAREDKEYVEGRLTKELVARGKDVWLDVVDIPGGSSDWRANVWAGIEAAKAMVFVLTPDSLASRVCGEELQRAIELNKRIVPVLRRPVDGLAVPPALERPNWVYASSDDEVAASMATLVAALELDEPWLDQHARLTERTAEWLRHDRDASYLLRGSDLSSAEGWLDEQGAHREAPTADQATYIGASRRASARRQRMLLAAVGLALAVVTALAVVALILRQTAVDRERIAQIALMQTRAAQSVAALTRDPEESVRRALEAVDIRPDEPEARNALYRAVSAAGWTSILAPPDVPGGSRPALLDVDFSPDGRRVATADADGGAGVWDTRTGRRIAVVAHPGRVHTVQLSPDGRRLLTAAADGTARTWDSTSGRRLHVFATGSPDVWAATYGAGGRMILTADAAGAQVWNAATGKRVARLPMGGDNYRGTIRLSLDGRRATTPGGEGGDLWVWDVAKRRRVATLPGDGQPVRFALFSENGRRIATIHTRSVRVWADGRRLAVIRPRRMDMVDVDFSSDGRRVVTAAGAEAEVWDVSSGSRIALLRNGASLASAQFDRGGRHVVTGDYSGVARVWDVSSARAISVLRGHSEAVRQARFSRDGTRIVTASDDGSARVWPARPRTPIDPRWRHADSTTFGPDSRHVLLAQGRRRAVWDVRTGNVVELRGGIFETDSPAWPCGRAAGCSPWSPDGRFVAGADARGRAVIWNARTGAVRQLVGPATGTVIGAAFSPDGRQVVVVDAERSAARIWTLDGSAAAVLVPAPRSRPGELQSAQFVADPLRVLTVDWRGVAQLTDPLTGVTVTVPGETRPPAVAVSSDGHRVATATSDGLLHVLTGHDAAGRTVRVSRGPIGSVAWQSDGAALATAGRDGTVRIWDARTLEPTDLPASVAPVEGATFTPDGNLLLVTSGSTVRLWDRVLPGVALEIPNVAGVSAELSPDAAELVIAGTRLLEARPCFVCAPFAELETHARSLLPVDG